MTAISVQLEILWQKHQNFLHLQRTSKHLKYLKYWLETLPHIQYDRTRTSDRKVIRNVKITPTEQKLKY